LAAGRHTLTIIQRWEDFSLALRNRTGNRLRSLFENEKNDFVPQEIRAIFQHYQENTKLTIDEKTRVRYYKEFTKAALGSSVLRFDQVERLVKKLDLVKGMSRADLHNIMSCKLEEASQLDQDDNGEAQVMVSNDLFNFEHLLSLICHLRKSHKSCGMASPCSLARLRSMLPIYPESAFKQTWDLFCLLVLLYCCFSVPIFIAFDDSTPTPFGYVGGVLDIVELGVDSV
jgi:hypothetical protein